MTLRSPEDRTLTVAELQATVKRAIVSAFPGPVWVTGEVSGLRRTSRGACFFRLVDGDSNGNVVDVAARGRVMWDVDRLLDSAGVGALRDGVAVRVQAVVGLDAGRSVVRLDLLSVDPEFIAGRIALDRQKVLELLRRDGALDANRRLELPLVPLRVGLVTSRGSAAHADFLDQLRRSGFGFRVRTAHAVMQGSEAVPSVVEAIQRLSREDLDVIVIARGGGAKLDLAAFDAEAVGRAVAAAPVPVVVGIGHEIDRTVVDEAAAVSVKTPTAAGEWLTGRVAEFARRIDTARRVIADEARAVCNRSRHQLEHTTALIAGAATLVGRQRDRLDDLAAALADSARQALRRQRAALEATEQTLEAYGLEATLRRGFALVRRRGGGVVRRAGDVSPGESLEVRLADGELGVTVDDG